MSETKLDWDSFEPLLGTYAPRMKEFFMKGGLDPVYERLKFDGKRGVKIAPLPSNVFRCFQETPIDNIKVIIVGLAPYHTFYNNLPVADGLCMSCSVTGRIQPSLDKFYDAMFKELGAGSNAIKEPDLKYLAESGVLLLNAALTTGMGKPGNHLALWEPFMKHLFENVLITCGMPVVFLGKEASKLKRYVFPFTWTFELSHPASAAYNDGDWDSEGIFTKVNQILKDNNNDKIEWFKTKN